MSTLQSSEPNVPNTGGSRSTGPCSDATVSIDVHFGRAVCLNETLSRDWWELHVCIILFYVSARIAGPCRQSLKPGSRKHLTMKRDIRAILTYVVNDCCELCALDMSLESFTAEITEALAPMRPAIMPAISSPDMALGGARGV